MRYDESWLYLHIHFVEVVLYCLLWLYLNDLIMTRNLVNKVYLHVVSPSYWPHRPVFTGFLHPVTLVYEIAPPVWYSIKQLFLSKSDVFRHRGCDVKARIIVSNFLYIYIMYFSLCLMYAKGSNTFCVTMQWWKQANAWKMFTLFQNLRTWGTSGNGYKHECSLWLGLVVGPGTPFVCFTTQTICYNKIDS